MCLFTRSAFWIWREFLVSNEGQIQILVLNLFIQLGNDNAKDVYQKDTGDIKQ